MSDKKLIYVLDRKKQIPISSGQRVVVDFIKNQSTKNIQRTCGFVENGKIIEKIVDFNIIGNQKVKTNIMKVDKGRRDPTRKGQCAFFTVIREVLNGN